MYGRSNNIGSNFIGRSDKPNNSSSNFQRISAPNLLHNNFANRACPPLIHGTAGLIEGSSHASQQQRNPSFAAHSQSLVNQQHRLLQMTKKELEMQQMASNIKESMLIERMQQREVNMLRAEMHLKAASQVAANNIGHRRNSIGNSNHGLLSSATKNIPSSSNSSVLPTKQREDERTKPDLSTLAETAVAVASAASAAGAHGRNRSDLMGIDRIIKMNSNGSGNSQFAALLRKHASSSVPSEKGMLATESLISQSMASSAMMDALRRDLDMNRDKMNLQSNYKRSLDEIAKSKSSSLWKSSMEQLRAEHEQQQRRNSLPAPISAAASENASLRSLKRQRLLERGSRDIRELELHDAMNCIKQFKTSNCSLLAEMSSKVASQERRASIGSSNNSVGTAATAPNLTTNSALSSPVNRRSITIPNNNFDECSNVLNKISKMGGGFPMPKFTKKEGINTSFIGIQSKVPSEIVQALGKEVSLNHDMEKIEKDEQLRSLERIGGFPIPSLYRHDDEMRQYDTAFTINDSDARSRNAISSHIRNNVNRSSTKISRPPALESYKRVWHDIRAVMGDDPLIEQLRREVFAEKLYRGEILMQKNSFMNNGNDRNVNGYVPSRVPSRHSSDLSVSVNSISGAQTNDPATEDSIVI